MDINQNRSNKTYSIFRVTLDLAMGIVYLFIGFVILYFHSFGTVEISPKMSYIFGGLIILYGLFRIYRGVKEILPFSKNNS